MNNITPEIILDGFLILVLFIDAIVAYRNGFITSVIDLIGNIGSLIVAWYISGTYSQQIFDMFFRDSLITRSYNYLVEAAQNIDIETALNSIIGKLPQEFVNTIFEKTEESLSGVIAPTQESAVYLVDTFIAPIVVACISVVVFLVCFALFKVVCRMLAKIFKGVNKLPLLGTANKLAGFLVGVIIGGVNIILLSFLLSIIVIITEDSLSWMNSTIIAQSKILALTGMINPFLP